MNRHLPTFLLLAFLMAALSSTACVYESKHLNDLKCSPDGKRQGDARCIDGLWIYDPVDDSALSDAGSNPGEDSGSDVVEPPLDSGDDVQDVGTDASADTSSEDSGNQDTSPADTDDFDTSQPDSGDTDIGDADVGAPDTGGVIGDPCVVHDQCASGYCENGIVCAVNLCTNGVQDNGEVDIDCGGTCEQECSGYKQTAAGGRHTCAIRADDSVMCWGHANQLIGVPTADQKFKSLTAGDRFTCGILHDASSDPNQSNVRCWGKLDGNKDHGIFNPPDVVQFTSISAGQEHICGVTTTQILACWGNNGSRRAEPAYNKPPHDNTPWSQVTSGKEHSCATTVDNHYKCWGSYADNRREFGDEFFNKQFKHLMAGDKHTCIIHLDNSVECVAKNKPRIKQDVPKNVIPLKIDSRTDYACIIINDQDSLICWGDDSKNRVSGAPEFGQFTEISTGWEHACALNETGGQITCWGNITDKRYPTAFAAP